MAARVARLQSLTVVQARNADAATRCTQWCASAGQPPIAQLVGARAPSHAYQPRRRASRTSGNLAMCACSGSPASGDGVTSRGAKRA